MGPAVDLVGVGAPHSDANKIFGAGRADEETAGNFGKFGAVFVDEILGGTGEEGGFLGRGGGEVDHDLGQFDDRGD